MSMAGLEKSVRARRRVRSQSVAPERRPVDMLRKGAVASLASPMGTAEDLDVLIKNLNEMRNFGIRW